MATLTKRVQVLIAEDEWLELKRLSSRRESSVGRLIREAIAQTYFTPADAQISEDRVRSVEKLIALDLPVDDWDVLEAEMSDRSYFDESGA
ncbi:MAG: hypothetical protein HC802_13720 [Caldilineaceae bacterium]|nr:hypothetical protein [Caldilineaceae bacterium]